ncbi:transcriptional regulator FeaR [Pseudomonas putida]|uniref:Transcriptional activator FeaR n=1 Tax=Pseudomonas putida TaxID=303 RepID=A0A1Q9R4R5_PSEPU|nr:transcriptional regulator FeaR [Pseudomonas putida]OLS62358.1 Transcriptional activator FeaR [Pseudomonas putida]
MFLSSSEQIGFERWCQSLRSICGNFSTLPSSLTRHFIGEIHSQTIGALDTAHIRTNARLISRELIGVDSDDSHCFLIYQRSGRQRIRQAGMEVELGPEDIALVDSARLFEIEPLGLVENISVHLSRDIVTRQFKGDNLFGKLSRNNVSSRMVRSLVQSIGMLGDGAANGDDGQAIQNALVSLVLPAMSGQTQGEGHLLESNSLFATALRLVDESLQDIDLGPAYLADQLHTSVRSLYRLFEEHGESVSRYILRTRLTKVAHDLCCHTLRSQSITQIAFKWGFVDVAHFSRAFKRQFEVSPRDYRAHAFQV